MSSISQNIQSIQQILSEYSHPVSLVAVTKNCSLQQIEEAINNGIKIIGENKIQEAKQKLPFLKYPVKKHFIGHLQTNKVKDAVKLFDLIQSVDTFKLAQKIDQEAKKQGKIMPILIQVNISNDPNKFGMDQETLIELLKQSNHLTNITIQGLMTIGRLTDHQEEIRSYYRRFKQLFDEINRKGERPARRSPALRGEGWEMRHLSMGMSADYEIALQEGSNMVRIGQKIFK